MAASPPRDQTRTTRDWLVDRAVGLAIGAGLSLPRRARVPFVGALTRTALGRGRFFRRAMDNLALIWPEMDPDEARAIAYRSLDNIGRTIIENLDARSLKAAAPGWHTHGPGLAALDAARDAGKPAIIVSGHYGNWEAARTVLAMRGHTIGALYRPLNNGYLHDREIAALSALGGPTFPRGRHGLGQFIRFLRGGHTGGILVDQFVAEGPMLDFLGQPAPTTLSAAELALRYDAPLIPFYGIRQPDGRSFEIVVEAPIPPGPPEAMMQAVNDSLAARVTADPGQWLWMHRRWKPDRIARLEKLAAAGN